VFPPGAIEAIVGTTTTQAGDVLSSTSSAIAAGSSDLECLGRDIFTFLVASVVVVPLAKTLKVSPVLGFLLVGCVLGPFGLATFSNNAADLELGDFGILFLLFNEGLALTPERIRDLNRFSTLGLIELVAAIALFSSGIIFGGQYILDFVEGLGIPLNDALLRPILDSPVQAFSIAAAGALSSSAFVLPVLSQKKWKDRPEGIAGLSILLLQDLAVAPLLVIIPLLAGSGPQSWSEFGLLLAKASLGFGTVLVFGSYILRYVFDVVASARSTETFVSFVPWCFKVICCEKDRYVYGWVSFLTFCILTNSYVSLLLYSMRTLLLPSLKIRRLPQRFWWPLAWVSIQTFWD
jgi:Kef-type K+ transport system membrane component KefB